MKILLATDGSEAANAAVEFVRSIACENSVEVIVATASYDPAHYSMQPWVPEWTEAENARTQAILNQTKASLENSCQAVTTVHGAGATVPFILDQSKAFGADLIVMGAKGHSTLTRILLGSTSDSVATRAECSVVVVRPNSTKATAAPQRIVLGYDKSVASREAAAELMEWKLDRETTIDVISVAQQPFVMIGEGYAGPPLTIPPEQLSAIEETCERMASQIAEHFPHTQAHTTVAEHMGDAIVRTAEENAADLIVVGDSGHSLLGEFLLGSTSRYVLRHAPCSVLISRHHWKD